MVARMVQSDTETKLNTFLHFFAGMACAGVVDEKWVGVLQCP